MEKMPETPSLSSTNPVLDSMLNVYYGQVVECILCSNEVPPGTKVPNMTEAIHRQCFKCGKCGRAFAVGDEYEKVASEFCCKVCPDTSSSLRGFARGRGARGRGTRGRGARGRGPRGRGAKGGDASDSGAESKDNIILQDILQTFKGPVSLCAICGVDDSRAVMVPYMPFTIHQKCFGCYACGRCIKADEVYNKTKIGFQCGLCM